MATMDAETMPAGTSNGRVTYKDMADMMGRVERELRDGQKSIEGKLDGFILAHNAVHVQEQARVNDHLTNSAVMGERAMTFSRKQEGLEQEVSELRDWRSEMRGMGNLIKFAVGGSLIGAAVSMLTLFMMLSKFAPAA